MCNWTGGNISLRLEVSEDESSGAAMARFLVLGLALDCWWVLILLAWMPLAGGLVLVSDALEVSPLPAGNTKAISLPAKFLRSLASGGVASNERIWGASWLLPPAVLPSKRPIFLRDASWPRVPTGSNSPSYRPFCRFSCSYFNLRRLLRSVGVGKVSKFCTDRSEEAGVR